METKKAKDSNKIKKYYKTIVIGGGAGGLFFGAACPAGSDVLILDRNKSLGIKLLMSGSGHCNITHGGSIKDFINCYGQNGKKIRSCLYRHNNIELHNFMSSLGVHLIEREDGKIFPASMNAKEIRDALVSACIKSGITLKTNSCVNRLSKTRKGFDVYFSDTDSSCEILSCTNLIIASGGSSYPTTGSDGMLMKVLSRDLGINPTILKPALVPVYTENYPFSDLSGISLKSIGLKINNNETGLKISTQGDLLFTHKNLSGPIILNSSRYISPGTKLDFNFVFPYNEKDLLNNIKNNMPKNSKKLSVFLGEKYLLPKRFVERILSKATLEDKKLSSLSGKDISAIGREFCHSIHIVSGLGSFKESMVTKGGFSLQDVNTITMESTTISGLFFVGEVLDIDGDTGGYNLQFAYSSAMACRDEIINKKKEVF